ncbi:MAG: non-hydrolyzing UDP-N-acetylglucosamine 2-epimerase [Thiohalocapsa sp.]
MAGKLAITCVVGTRPEAIKMAPVIRELQRCDWARVSVLSTAQHRHMVDPLLRFFGIAVDDDLDVMTVDQSLPRLTGRLLERIADALAARRPDLVIAQGDTTTVMATAIACFYAGIPFAHVEAGLRTGDLRQPFPEEFNRAVAARVAALNFAPTDLARRNLLREGIAAERIVITGNTVIDALLWTAQQAPEIAVPLGAEQRLLFVTLHRRESFGAPLRNALMAIRRLVAANPALIVLYPVHPNPNVSGPAHELLGGIERVTLCAPLDYPDSVSAMRRAHLILTDSGGIQEEAPALGKPVLVAREITERPEAVEAGVARLVGTDAERICREVQRLLDDRAAYSAMAKGVSPYGDGHAARRIRDAIAAFHGGSPVAEGQSA